MRIHADNETGLCVSAQTALASGQIIVSNDKGMAFAMSAKVRLRSGVMVRGASVALCYYVAIAWQHRATVFNNTL